MTFAVYDRHATGEACFGSILSFSVLSFLFALTIHLAQHPSRTPCHGVKKREVATDIPEDGVMYHQQDVDTLSQPMTKCKQVRKQQ